MRWDVQNNQSTWSYALFAILRISLTPGDDDIQHAHKAPKRINL